MKNLLPVALIAIAFTGCSGQFAPQSGATFTVEAQGVVDFSVAFSDAITKLEVEKEASTDPDRIHHLDLQIQEMRNMIVTAGEWAKLISQPLIQSAAATTRPSSASAAVLPVPGAGK